MARGMWKNWEEVKKAIHENNLNIVVRHNNLVQDVVVYSDYVGKIVTIINLGAGVKRITSSDVKICPCCGRQLN